MNVVVAKGHVMMAADEVREDGERVPLTNFQAWDLEEDPHEKLSKFNAFLASRSISENERRNIISQTRRILEVLQGKAYGEAFDAVKQLGDDIEIRDGKSIVTRSEKGHSRKNLKEKKNT